MSRKYAYAKKVFEKIGQKGKGEIYLSKITRKDKKAVCFNDYQNTTRWNEIIL